MPGVSCLKVERTRMEGCTEVSCIVCVCVCVLKDVTHNLQNEPEMFAECQPPAPLRLPPGLPDGGRGFQGSSVGGVAEPPHHTLAFAHQLGVAHKLALSRTCRHNNQYICGRLLLRQVRCIFFFFISVTSPSCHTAQCDAQSMFCSLTADWLAPPTLPLGMRKHWKSICEQYDTKNTHLWKNLDYRKPQEN